MSEQTLSPEIQSNSPERFAPVHAAELKRHAEVESTEALGVDQTRAEVNAAYTVEKTSDEGGIQYVIAASANLAELRERLAPDNLN